jgi:hypothetical protein
MSLPLRTNTELHSLHSDVTRQRMPGAPWLLLEAASGPKHGSTYTMCSVSPAQCLQRAAHPGSCSLLHCRSPCLVAHPAALGVKRLELPPRLDSLPAVCLAPHSTACYDGHIPAAAALVRLSCHLTGQSQQNASSGLLHMITSSWKQLLAPRQCSVAGLALPACLTCRRSRMQQPVPC